MVSKTNNGGWKNENGNSQHRVSSLFVLSFLVFMLLSVSQVWAVGEPIITGLLYLNESDIFVSNVSPNDIITVFADVNSAGPNQISYVTANFSVLNQTGSGLVNGLKNMTQLNGSANYNGTWYTSINVTNVSNMDFVALNITAIVYNNASQQSSPSYVTILLYNMTTPPAGGCQQWGASTTNLATKTNFSNVNYVLEVQMNLSNCTGIPYNNLTMPSWFNNYTTLSLINFTSLNMSNETTGPKLANLSNNMQINITPQGQFGDSRIYFDTTYFVELNTTTVVTLYHLPFTSQPAIAEDPGAAGVNATLGWTQGIGDGNLSFRVNGFSGYNATDNVTPTITINSPLNMSNTSNKTPPVNLALNGTGTQISQAIILIDSTQYIYNSTNNATNCTAASNGSELFNCVFAPASNLTEGNHTLNITVFDYGGASPGNNKTSSTNFTVDSVAPVFNATSTTLNDTYISSGQTVLVTANVSDATTGVKNVTANGQNMSYSSGLWLLNLTLSGSEVTANVTIVAYDYANNINTTNVSYTIDNTAPVITVTSPANGLTWYSTVGNLTLNYTITETNISSSNVSIDGGVWIGNSTSNASISMNFTGIDAGTHTIVITAYDNASLSSTSTTTFTMSAPVNVTEKIGEMQTSVGNTTLVNVTLKDPANASNDYTSNETLNATALALSMQMSVNATTNATVTIVFNGSSANWNATNFDIETDISSLIGANTTQNTGANVTVLVVFTNMSNFLANTAYTNGTIIVFNQSLNNLTVLYISDDTGSAIYKLENCGGNTAPSVIDNSTKCYVNSTNVTIYIPHLSGAALANDTTAPTVNITSPLNATYNNSYVTFSFDAWEANPAASFCWYNFTNSTGQVSYATLGMSSFTQTGTKYSYSGVLSGLANNAYNITVNCADVNNQNTSVTHNFTISDTTKPVITAISNSVSGSSVTITVTTNENAACRYYASDANYSNMTNFTTTGALSHSTTISSLSNGAYTYYVRCNDTAGNNMTTSNSTAFTISVTSGCTPSWSCTQWSTCLPSNTQARTCTDSNVCGTNTSKPIESQYCYYVASITSPACGTGCPTGQAQRIYPDCSCYLPICTTTCGTGQTQRAYPDCSCVTPSNVTIPVERPKEPVIVATRGGAIITIPAIAAERRSPISISAVISNVTGIMEIALTPIRNLVKVKIEISKLDAKPESVDAPPKTTYRYYEIKAENMTENDLSNVTITFKVDKFFIGTKYNASTVTMMRHVSGGWMALNTTMLSQTTTEYIFETTTPGFSYFAITVAELVAPPVVSPPPTNGTTTQPGLVNIDWTLIIWVLGIIVVVAVAVMANNMLKAKKKWKPRSPR